MTPLNEVPLGQRLHGRLQELRSIDTGATGYIRVAGFFRKLRFGRGIRLVAPDIVWRLFFAGFPIVVVPPKLIA